METEEEEESNLGRSLTGRGVKKGGKEANVKSGFGHKEAFSDPSAERLSLADSPGEERASGVSNGRPDDSQLRK